jgi:long-chain acyl-CoA synthetase
MCSGGGWAQVAPERARIESAIAGKTLVGALAETVARFGDAAAMWWRSTERWQDPRPGGWERWTWRTFRRHVQDLFGGLRHLGVGRGDFVVLMTDGNNPSQLVADQAVMHLGATPVSLYPTLSASQLSVQAGYCGARVAVVQGPGVLERALAVPGLERIVAADASSGDPRVIGWSEVVELGRREGQRDPGALDEAAGLVGPGDLATLIWTSGTTDGPKAVMVTHRTVLWMQESLHLVAAIGPSDRLVSYLPMAHLAGRFLSAWQPVIRGTAIWLCPDLQKLGVALAEARPTRFFGVPRVWEKYAAALGPALTEARASASVAEAGAMLLERAGLDRCRLALTGGAPIAVDVLELFRTLGLDVSEMWGMTETGPATWNGVRDVRFGTVGRRMPGVEVRLAGDGELLVRGGGVTPGYFRDPEATAEAVDADGWMHSGDLGSVDADGYFRILDRKKEIIVTSGGTNVSPVILEGVMKRHDLVAEVCVVGHGRPYPSALVVLDRPAVTSWARARGIGHLGLQQLVSHPEVRQEVGGAVDAANRMVSRPEQIKRFTILPTQWTVESEEVSPTLKLRRRRIHEKYAAEIESMYA